MGTSSDNRLLYSRRKLAERMHQISYIHQYLKFSKNAWNPAFQASKDSYRCISHREFRTHRSNWWRQLATECIYKIPLYSRKRFQLSNSPNSPRIRQYLKICIKISKRLCKQSHTIARLYRGPSRLEPLGAIAKIAARYIAAFGMRWAIFGYALNGAFVNVWKSFDIFYAFLGYPTRLTCAIQAISAKSWQTWAIVGPVSIRALGEPMARLFRTFIRVWNYP